MKFKGMTHRLIFFLLFILSHRQSLACCTVWGGDLKVQIAAQEVLVVWDSQKKIEHFVRRADFKTETMPKDFGFIVPTPTRPELREISDDVFESLNKVIEPEVRVEKKTKFSFIPLSLLLGSRSLETETAYNSKFALSVEVLETRFIGGFEATILRATEAGPLLEWLKDNGYDSRPELREWLEPYLEKQWIVTAFKYSKNPQHLEGQALTSKAICMSFETQQPFFPYRVPSDLRVEPEEGSLLRLHFASNTRVKGLFNNDESQPWKAKIPYAAKPENLDSILHEISSDSGSNWLTTFEDNTWPGGAADLYFQDSSSSQSITPPPIITTKLSMIHIPADLVLLVGILGAWLYRKRKKLQHR